MDTPDIILVEDIGDRRGFCYAVPDRSVDFLRRAKTGAVLSVGPGEVRGDHFHQMKQEMIMVIFSDSWTLSSRERNGAETIKRRFEGRGMAVITMPPLYPHAIKNDGKADLILVDLSDTEHDPEKPDVIRSVISE